MLSFFDKGRRKKALAVAVAAFTVMALAGCSKEQQAPQATLVKTMEVIKRDTPIVYDYTGFVQAQKEVNLMAQVSGQITGKYFLGGEKITAGQTLFTIDQRTYQAKVLNAQAGLASAQATLIVIKSYMSRTLFPSRSLITGSLRPNRRRLLLMHSRLCWKMPILIWEKLMSLRLLTDV